MCSWQSAALPGSAHPDCGRCRSQHRAAAKGEDRSQLPALTATASSAPRHLRCCRPPSTTKELTISTISKRSSHGNTALSISKITRGVTLLSERGFHDGKRIGAKAKHIKTYPQNTEPTGVSAAAYTELPHLPLRNTIKQALRKC